jgi:hypothetical protein
MEPSQDFVDNHAIIFHRQAEIEVEDETLPVEISLSEGGQLNLETSRMGLDTEGLETGIYPEVTGTTEQGEQVIVSDLFCFADELLSLNPQVIEICRNTERVVQGEEVTLQADVLGFQYQNPLRSFNPDVSVDLLERSDWRVGGGNHADWKITLRPLPDYPTRVNSVQNYQNLVRTVQLEISIDDVYGGLNRIGAVTDEILDQIAWLSSYVQGTLPFHSKLEIRDGEDEESEYIRLRGLASNVGGCCRRSNLLLFMAQQELPLYLDRALERYLEIEEQLELRRILGFYVDSLHPSRPVDVKFTNLCIATEMLAKKYLPDQGSTEAQIEELVNELGVEFMDLIPDNGSLKTRYGDNLDDIEDLTLEYFWFRARNHVVHGGRDVTTQEIIRDYNALLVLLQRFLREVLLQGNTEGLRGMTQFGPEDLISR